MKKKIPTANAKICAAILKAKKILVVSHLNPDPDAYGSSLGVTLALRKLRKNVTIFNRDGALPGLSFFPGITTVLSSLPDLASFDLAIVCDCGDEKRVGDGVWDKISQIPSIVNIDHHVSNTKFGTIRLVQEKAASSSEIVLSVLETLEKKTKKKIITPEVAFCLYAGLVSDTGSFRYQAVNAQTFEIAGRLVARGAKPAVLADLLYSQDSLASVRIQGEALSTVEFIGDGKIGIVVVSEAMFKKYHATAEDTEGLVEKVRSIKGVEVAAFLREEDGFFKASLRTRTTRYDVSRIARLFGGGGHVCAAGFRKKGSLEEVRSLLIPELETLVKQ